MHHISCVNVNIQFGYKNIINYIAGSLGACNPYNKNNKIFKI